MSATLLLTGFLPAALAVIMLGMGLSLTVADFRRVLAYPRAVAVALVCQVLVLPLVCAGIAHLYDLDPTLAVGMMLLAASPGGTAANLYSHLARGDVALNVTLTAVNSVLAIVTLPIIVNLSLLHFFGEGKVLPLQIDKIMQVFAIVLVPVAIGMWLRQRHLKFAERMAGPVKIASVVFLVTVILIAVLTQWTMLVQSVIMVGLAALSFNLVSLAVGYVVPRLLGVNARQATAIGMEIGIHNGTLAIAIAASPLLLNNQTMAIPAAIYGLIAFATAALFGWFVGRSSLKNQRQTIDSLALGAGRKTRISLRKKIGAAVGVAVAIALIAACNGRSPSVTSDSGQPIDPAIPVLGAPTATKVMEYCADLGEKQPGNAASAKMAALIADRFSKAGLTVSRESFHVPSYRVKSAAVEVISPTPRVIPSSSFAYGGTGVVEAEVVDVGAGHASDYTGVDAAGKIVMVTRDVAFHRTAQFAQVLAHKGAGMLYVGSAPKNLIQVGAVRFANQMPATIPTMSIGADDGAALKNQIGAGPVRIRMSVDATRVDAVGTNILGVKRGSIYPDEVIVVGGHYDTWSKGAVDNCSAMGSMLQVAEELADEKFAYTVIFGAWDAEESGLIGSYDWVRNHQDIVQKVVVNENMEMTASATQVGDTEIDESSNLLFITSSPVMNTIVAQAMAKAAHVAAPVPAAGIRAIQGGIITTDMNPFYTAGVQGFSTFSNSAYYHTHEDTEAHLPQAPHLRATNFLTNFLRDIQIVPPLALRLQEVPKVAVTVPAQSRIGEPVEITIKATLPGGLPLTGNPPVVLVNERDHWAIAEATATEVGGGEYRFTVDRALIREPGRLWVRATFSADLYAAEGYGNTLVMQ